MRYLLLLALSFSFLSAGDYPEEVFVDELDESEFSRGENLARFTYSDKYVYVTHESDNEEQAVRNMPAVSGDLVKTRTASFAEVEFIDGSLLQIADRTDLEFQAINEVYNNESLSVFKLYKGSLFLHVTDEWNHADRRVFRVDSASGSAYIEAPGIYRIDTTGTRMTLKVYRGFAELSGKNDSVPVYSGEYSFIRHMDRPNATRSFNSFQSDRFGRWAYERRPVTDSVSDNYVDSSISSYAHDLDDNGEWRYSDEYGSNVWVPYTTSGWRPYNNGYWTPRHGRLTWVSYDPFGWVTHHYGRWGWGASLGWHWLPGYHYSPAWVAWSSFDTYVGWCPLGYRNRPYYYRGGRYNTVIVNNHYNTWNYVSSTRILKRERVYPDRRVRHTGGKRLITTRRINVGRGETTRITNVIRNPETNRRLASSRTVRRGTLSTRGDNGVKRVKISSTRTGTRTVSRHSPNIVRSSTSRNRSSEYANSPRGGSTRGSNDKATSSSRRNSSLNSASRGNSHQETSRSSVTRGGSSRSNSSATPNSNGSRSRSSATRNNNSNSKPRSSATRNNSSSKPRSSATRNNSSSKPRSSATRNNNSNSKPRSSATRNNSSSKPRSSATRNNSSSKPRSSANRSNSSSKPRSSANRSNSSSKPRSSANRSNSSSKPRSSATRSNSSSKPRSSATRKSSSKPRSSATRSSSKSSSKSSRSKKNN